MGQKEPRGKAMPIGGACSKPKDVDQYNNTVDASSTPKNTDMGNVVNSSTPDPKSTGKPKVF